MADTQHLVFPRVFFFRSEFDRYADIQNDESCIVLRGTLYLVPGL